MTHRFADCAWVPPSQKAKLALIEESMQREPSGRLKKGCSLFESHRLFHVADSS